MLNNNKKVIVTGDFIFDQFVLGDVNRISPEAPNLILDLSSLSAVRGGAYNVVEHCRSLGIETRFHSVCGRQPSPMAAPENIRFEDNDHLIWDFDRPLTTKTRFISNYKYHTLLRVDNEVRNNISEKQTDELLASIGGLAGQISVICVVDYVKGVVSDRLMKGILKIADECGAKVIVDTKRPAIEIFSGVWLIKPNLKEFQAAKVQLGFRSNSDEDFAHYLYETLGIINIVVTRGNEGLVLYQEGIKSLEVPGVLCTPMEFSGAGDSVMACLTCAINEGAMLAESVVRANRAAAVFVSRPASYRITREDLAEKTKPERRDQ
jgi:D-beta-D-heptose 7-phosphate kinase/D-beta-D-heptose 1-phosphate adenosyltransferase